MVDLNYKKRELAMKYNIDFEKLEKEQVMLAKRLEIKDKIDFSLVNKIGGVDVIFLKNKMLCCFIVCDKNYEITDMAYVIDKIKFPYVPGFRNYRELPSIIAAFEKLNEKPDVVFISAHGIIHPKLGLASHFGLVTGIPTIGVSNSLVDCKVESGKIIDGENVIKNNKKIGRVLITKEGSNPMYINPGDYITVKSAYELSKKLINPPHKKPEPLHLAGKYAKKVKEELNL